MYEWNVIAELTDQNVLGTEGSSHQEPQKKARAILMNHEGKYAVMYEKKADIYALPGGGIDAGEEAVTALKREILEETGCTCDTVEPLGIVYENRYHADVTRISYFFVARTNTKKAVQHLTDEEQSLETLLKWCSLDELIHLLREPQHQSKQKKFLQARDLAALASYMSTLQKQL